jgi:hypothetical protein
LLLGSKTPTGISEHTGFGRRPSDQIQQGKDNRRVRLVEQHEFGQGEWRGVSDGLSDSPIDRVRYLKFDKIVYDIQMKEIKKKIDYFLSEHEYYIRCHNSSSYNNARNTLIEKYEVLRDEFHDFSKGAVNKGMPDSVFNSLARTEFNQLISQFSIKKNRRSNCYRTS